MGTHLHRRGTALIVTATLLGFGGLVAAPAANAAGIVLSYGASAFGVSANATVAGSVRPVTVVVNPVPIVSLPPGQTSPQSLANSLASLSASPLLSAGVLNVAAGGSLAQGANASASVASLAVTAIPAAPIAALTVASTCHASGSGISGSTTITSLRVAGVQITLPATIPPNFTVVSVPGVLRIVLNEQSGSTSATGNSLTVSAIHVSLLATGVATGDVYVAQSQCSTVQTQPGTLAGHIFLCSNGQPTTQEVANGTIGVTQGSAVIDPPAANPVSYTVMPGTYTLTATPPAGYQFVSCGGSGGGNTVNVNVPPGGTGQGGNFYVVPIPSVTVSVGYADDAHTFPGAFPSVWSGSPNVIFDGHPFTAGGGEQCASNCWDAGAVRVDNTSVGTESVTVTVTIGSTTYDLWGTHTVPVGGTLILTENDNLVEQNNFDTSEDQPCTQDGIVPVLTMTVNGQQTVLHDTGQVLNTGGIELDVCIPGSNEAHDWAALTG
jgi:hypothetical protein